MAITPENRESAPPVSRIRDLIEGLEESKPEALTDINEVAASVGLSHSTEFDSVNDQSHTKVITNGLFDENKKSFSERHKIVRLNKLKVLGAIALTGVAFFATGQSNKLDDNKIVPYSVKVMNAAKTLNSKSEISKFPGKDGVSLGKLAGRGEASLYVELPVANKLRRVSRKQRKNNPLYKVYRSSAVRSGTADIVASAGLLKKLEPVHAEKANSDQGWSLKATIDPSAIKTERNEMNTVHASYDGPDAWLVQGINRMLGVEQASFHGSQNYQTEWADMVFTSNCASPGNAAGVPKALKSKLNTYVEQYAAKISNTAPEEAAVIRNMLPVKQIEYSGGSRIKFQKNLIPGHVQIAGSLGVGAANVKVGVGGSCRPRRG